MCRLRGKVMTSSATVLTVKVFWVHKGENIHDVGYFSSLLSVPLSQQVAQHSTSFFYCCR